MGRGPGDLVAELQGLLALLPAAPPEPESRMCEGCPRQGGWGGGGNHSPMGKCTEHPASTLNRLPLNCSGIRSSELKRHTSTPYPVPSPKQAAYEQLPLSN